MQLKFDWLIVLEKLRRGIMVTDVTLDGPGGPRIIYVNSAWLKMTGYDREELRGKTPRILQGKHTDHAVVGLLKQKLLNREVFHGQTWNYRKSGEQDWHEGQTVNISRTGILFLAGCELTPQTSLELRILFPKEITGESSMDVICWGPVVRTEPARNSDSSPATAAAILRYRFSHE